jgi:hypothetical protein
MQRKTFDLLASTGGAIIVAVLVVAGVLLMWGASFANSNVHTQLAQQQITFPAASAFKNVTAPKPGQFAEVTPSMIPSVSQYAGQKLTTGAQADVYANDFIGEHILEIGGGLTYSELSAKAMALNPNSPAGIAANAQVETVFKGTTLRGLLLEAYGFSVFGNIAQDGAIAAFALAALMALLTGFGFYHSRRTSEAVELAVHTRTTTTRVPSLATA